MKILALLNVTNLQRMACDSGFIFQRLVAPHLLAMGHQILFASPVGMEGLSSAGFKHIPLSLGGHKFAVRFNFPWPTIERILDEHTPDLIWINQAELASAMRALLSSIGSSARLITYLHYFPYALDATATPDKLVVDASLCPGAHRSLVPLAFLNGAMASDVVLVHSSYALQLLAAGLEAFSLSMPRSTQVFVVPPPFDPALLPVQRKSFGEKNVILYNHRLYAQYGTDRLVQFLHQGIDIGEHEFVVMDILGPRSPERQKLDNSVEQFRASLGAIPGVRIDSGGDDRAYYRDVLTSSKFAVAPFRRSCSWSMSVVDCLAAEVPVVAQNHAFFQELLPAQCLHDGTYDHFRHICQRLRSDELLWHECGTAGLQAVAHLTPARIAHRLSEIFTATDQDQAIRECTSFCAQRSL